VPRIDELPWASDDGLEEIGTARARAPGGVVESFVDPDLPVLIERARRWLDDEAEVAVEGERGEAVTFSVAARLGDMGVSESQAVELMLGDGEGSWNDRCDPPWAPDELAAKVANAYKYRATPIGSRVPEVAAAELGLDPAQPISKLREMVRVLVESRQAAPAHSETGLPVSATGAATTGGLPFVHIDEIDVNVEKTWLLKGLLAERETSSWIAPPKAGKSALLADIAMHVAGGRDWCGHKLKNRRAVVYLAFERGDLTKRRIEAFKRKHQVPRGWPVVVSIARVDFMKRPCVDVVADTIRSASERCGMEVGLLIIDTFAKAIAHGGGDENSAKDQNTVRGYLRSIQERTNVHIALIGHTGKDATKGERGSNANLGDVDIEFTINNGQVTISHTNDGKDGPVAAFAMEGFSFGVDEDGDRIEVGIAVAKPCAAREFDEIPLTPAEQAAIEQMTTYATSVASQENKKLSEVIFTLDVLGSLLRKKRQNVTKLMTQLGDKGRVKKIERGQWVISNDTN
jgi:hypothetical protein